MVTSDDDLDRTFSALAHPTRRAILSRLAQEGTATVSELAIPFDVSLMAISKHVSVMESAGLIRRRKEGRVHRCSLTPGPMNAARDWIEAHQEFWEQQLGSLARYLEESDKGETE